MDEKTNNDIFLKLGHNDANIQNLIGLQKKIDKKLDALGRSVTIIHQESKRAHVRIDGVEKEMITRNDIVKTVFKSSGMIGSFVALIWTALITLLRDVVQQ